MKKLLILLSLFCVSRCFAQQEQKQESVLWLQQPALSPNGQWVAFEYKSNIYKVPVAGGNAIPLTINSAYNGYPVWSHDGNSIAFASNRYGNFDVYVMPSSGGNAKRLTFNSAKDIPYDFSTDNSLVYFGTDRHDVSTSVRFPNDGLWMKLYSVPIKGGRNLMVNSAGTEYVHFNQTGNKFIFQDRKGYEDPWRKHHVSAVTRDIWVYDISAKSYNRLSDFAGEDREPVWGKGNIFYYLSERNGNQNLFESDTNHPSKVSQLTNFTKDPVRNLSRSENGLLAFTQGGELYTLQNGGTPLKINVLIGADFNTNQIQTTSIKDGATEMAISPNGKEVAFVARGEVFVGAINGSNTKRITNTPYREGMINFSPDGRTLIYSSEKNGLWQIDKATIGNSNEPYFYAATVINTSPLIVSDKNVYEGAFSPDGKSIAYVVERKILKVFNLATKTSVTVLPEGNIYPYVDGKDFFTWSPDNQYLLIPSSEGHDGHDNVILVRADGKGERLNLTKSGFDTQAPQWGLNGKMMYYLSDKEGLRSIAQGPSQSDIYAIFFDQALFNSFQLSKNDFALQEEIKKKDTSANSKIKHPLKPSLINTELNFKNIENRTLKLTQNSAELSDLKLSPDGDKMYFLAKYDDNFDLWVTTLRTHDTKKLTALNASSGSLELSKDGKNLYVLADGSIFKIDVENGDKITVGVNPVMELNADAERAAIFEHTYQRMQKLFLDPKLHGVDFKYYHDLYSKFLPYVNNNYDFQLLLSEFLGELNASHTGSRYRPSFPDGDETGALGLLYNEAGTSNGLTVLDVLEGSPFALANSNMRSGCIIDQIDGIALTATTDWALLLNRKKGQYTLVGFHNPKTGKSYQESIKPIGDKEEFDLLYTRWVHIMEHLTDSLSKGKVGYLHIREMNEHNYRLTIDRFEGKNRDKKAVIIDSRFNGGGNLHDQLVRYFSQRTNIVARPQSHYYIQDGPADGSPKPTCVLMSEGNYSDAFNFPYLYKRLGVGKLIGTPVAGTGTGVYWEREIDKTLIVGFPQLGLSWIGEEALLENHEVKPDIEVYNGFSNILSGRDEQLEAAVKEMLKIITKK